MLSIKKTKTIQVTEILKGFFVEDTTQITKLFVYTFGLKRTGSLKKLKQYLHFTVKNVFPSNRFGFC